MTKRLVRSFWVSVLAVGAICSRSHADIVFQLGNNPQSDEENILLNTGTTGPSVVGVANQSGIGVLFSSTTDILSEPATGQARVEAQDGFLNDITVSVPGGSFIDLIINPLIGEAAGIPGGTANVSVIANEPGGGTVTDTFSYTLGNGNNFLTMFAINGETIASVTIDSALGFTDLRQPRISGAALNRTPDGGSTLALLGTAVGALSMRRLRARKA
jgi:hypothetical protein